MRLSRIISVLSLLCVSLVSAQGPEIADYPFIKKIDFPALAVQQKIELNLDAETINDINSRFSNVGLYNTKNETVPFAVMHEPPSRIKKFDIIDVSSIKGENMDPVAMFDQDITTSFAFDKRIDKKNPATVTLDLGTPKRLNRIDVFVPAHARIYKIALYGGDDPENLERIMSERPFGWRNDLRSEPVRYLKIALWGFRVEVNDIRMSHSHTGKIFFTSEPDETMVLAYGGEKDRITYMNRVAIETNFDVEATLSEKTWNKLFVLDADKDGIKNEVDNCPFVNNRGQSDKDGDKIGDVCDNAINTKNYDQSDIDKDGVGDLIDNCKLKLNSNQKNSDGDQFGDVCDVVFNDPNIINDPEASSFNKMTFLYTLLSLLALFLIGYTYYTTRKK